VVKSKLKFFPEISKRVFFLLIEIPNWLNKIYSMSMAVNTI
jgi:hypothetical protein